MDRIARDRGLDPRNYPTKALLCSALLEETGPVISKFLTQPSVIHDLIFSFLPFDTPPLCQKFSSDYIKKKCVPPRQPHGVVETYYEIGIDRERRIKSRLIYWEGLLHGVARHWEKNGRLDSRIEFQYGDIHGRYETWGIGLTHSVELYQRGLLHGVSSSINYAGDRIDTPYHEGKSIEVRLFEGEHIARILSSDTGIQITKYLNPQGRITLMTEDYGSQTVNTHYNSQGGLREVVTTNPDTHLIQEEEFYPSGQIRIRTTRHALKLEVRVERWEQNGARIQ